MRQVGTLPSEREARQFAAWLVSQRIDAQAESENGGWVVWVREEDQLAKAREGLEQFRANPNDPQYQNAVQAAETLKRQEEAKRRQAQNNVVQMRGRWGAAGPGVPGSRRAPLVLTLIGLSALVAIVAYEDTIKDQKRTPRGDLYRSLLFVDPGPGIEGRGPRDNWVSVSKGEIWRLVSPIFIHYSLMHIVLNMIWLFSFGAPIEDRRGSLFMLFLVLTLAIASNLGQAAESSLRNHLALFGGMSGVGYGLFGYMAIKAKFDSREPYYLSPGTTFMAMLWFLLCILRDIPPFSSMLTAIPQIANSAHAVGLVVGAAIAYVPLLARKPA
jgi:GlpG protein